ncbi:hypothetical protein ACTG9Q_14950 [Actinokineospora sp. 24-640]
MSIDDRAVGQPAPSPLTILVREAALAGHRRVGLLDHAVLALGGRTDVLCAHLRDARPDVPAVLAVSAEISALSAILVDVLDGFVELRADLPARTRLCLVAERFADTVSSWVSICAARIAREGRRSTGEQLTSNWYRVEQEILGAVETCRKAPTW